MGTNQSEAREPAEGSLEMRVAALEDKLAGFSVTQDELDIYKKVMKVARLIRLRSASRGMVTPCIAAQGDCISGCVSPCDCSDCGCIEGCISASGCISGCISPCDCSDCGCVEGCVDSRAVAASGCISGCISPCDCSDCGCVEGCIDAAAARLRRGGNRMQRRFGRLGRF